MTLLAALPHGFYAQNDERVVLSFYNPLAFHIQITSESGLTQFELAQCKLRMDMCINSHSVCIIFVVCMYSPLIVRHQTKELNDLVTQGPEAMGPKRSKGATKGLRVTKSFSFCVYLIWAT